jgi:hypothetical protein
MGEILPFTDADTYEVAALFWKVFRREHGDPPASLADYLLALYLRNPWVKGAGPSLVYKVDGKVIGFIGGIPLAMEFEGRPVSAVVAGNHMVDPDARDPFVAPRLLKALLGGGQDLTFSDTANEASRRMWGSAGARISTLYSFRWMRVFKPMGTAMTFVGKSTIGRVSASILSPFTVVADIGLGRFINSRIRQGEPGLERRELKRETLLEGLKSFGRQRPLRPIYDAGGIDWLLSMAAEKQRFGDLYSEAVHKNSALQGWYLFYHRRGDVGQVVQFVARPQAVAQVFNTMCSQALDLGCVALVGYCDPEHTKTLTHEGCFYFHRHAYTVAHSRDTALAEAFIKGDVFLTRLEGEFWTRMDGDIFL